MRTRLSIACLEAQSLLDSDPKHFPPGLAVPSRGLSGTVTSPSGGAHPGNPHGNSGPCGLGGGNSASASSNCDPGPKLFGGMGAREREVCYQQSPPGCARARARARQLTIGHVFDVEASFSFTARPQNYCVIIRN